MKTLPPFHRHQIKIPPPPPTEDKFGQNGNYSLAIKSWLFSNEKAIRQDCHLEFNVALTFNA